MQSTSTDRPARTNGRTPSRRLSAPPDRRAAAALEALSHVLEADAESSQAGGAWDREYASAADWPASADNFFLGMDSDPE